MKILLITYHLVLLTSCLAQERNFERLAFNSIDKLSMEDLDFKEAKLSNEQFLKKVFPKLGNIPNWVNLNNSPVTDEFPGLNN